MREKMPQLGMALIGRHRRMAKRIELGHTQKLRKKLRQERNPDQLLFRTADAHLRALSVGILSFTATVIALIMLGLPGLVEYAYAQQESSTNIVQDTTALIAAFGALLGSIGGVIIAIVGFLSNKNKSNANSQELAETYNDLKKVGLSLQKTDNWVLENEEKLAKLVSAVSEFDPKIKDSLQSRSLEIRTLTEELRNAKRELDEAYDTVIPRLKVPRR
jgi:hypothetical protein